MKTRKPDISDSELAARLRLSVMRLARRLRQQSAAGVTPSQLSVLSTLSARGEMSLGALAEAERVRPPTMTRIVAALEEDGFVERASDPSDRRKATVRLTERGRRLITANKTRKTAYLAERLRELPPGDRATLADAARVLEAILDEGSSEGPS